MFKDFFTRFNKNKRYKSKDKGVKEILEIITGEEVHYSDRALIGYANGNPINQYMYNILYDPNTDSINQQKLKTNDFKRHLDSFSLEDKQDLCRNFSDVVDGINVDNVADKLSNYLRGIALAAANDKVINKASKKKGVCKALFSDNSLKSDVQIDDIDKDNNETSIQETDNSSNSPSIVNNTNQINKYDFKEIDKKTIIDNTHTEETNINNYDLSTIDKRTFINNSHTEKTTINQILSKDPDLKEKDKNEIDDILKELHYTVKMLISLNCVHDHINLCDEISLDDCQDSLKENYEKFDELNRKLEVYCKRHPNYSDLNKLYTLWLRLDNYSFSCNFGKRNRNDQHSDAVEYFDILDKLIIEICKF